MWISRDQQPGLRDSIRWKNLTVVNDNSPEGLVPMLSIRCVIRISKRDILCIVFLLAVQLGASARI
jgi:hypothetical protein